MAKPISDIDLEQQLFEGEPVIKFEKEVDRRNFLRYAGIIGVGSTLALAGCSSGSDEGDNGATPAASPTEDAAGENPDLGILNYALTLEYLEAEFYEKGIAGNSLSGREKELVTPIRDHEKAHVDALTTTIESLNGEPVAKPEFTFPAGTFTDKTKFLTTAQVFEELGVAAYHGQVKEIKNGEILGAAASIAGVESRHAAILNVLINKDPFPAAVETTKTKEEVLDAAKDFIKA